MSSRPLDKHLTNLDAAIRVRATERAADVATIHGQDGDPYNDPLILHWHVGTRTEWCSLPDLDAVRTPEMACRIARLALALASFGPAPEPQAVN